MHSIPYLLAVGASLRVCRKGTRGVLAFLVRRIAPYRCHASGVNPGAYASGSVWLGWGDYLLAVVFLCSLSWSLFCFLTFTYSCLIS